MAAAKFHLKKRVDFENCKYAQIPSNYAVAQLQNAFVVQKITIPFNDFALNMLYRGRVKLFSTNFNYKFSNL